VLLQEMLLGVQMLLGVRHAGERLQRVDAAIARLVPG
jgi:hypothetical protein